MALFLFFGGVLFVVGVLLFVIHNVALKRSARIECGQRLLEELATAYARAVPLADVIRAGTDSAPAPSGGVPQPVARSSRKRMRERAALDAIATELDEGTPIGDALTKWGKGMFPAGTLAALRAAAGTPAEGPMLAACARDECGNASIGHRVFMALLYPALVGTAVVPIWLGVSGGGLLGRWREVVDSIEGAGPEGALEVARMSLQATGIFAVVFLASLFIARLGVRHWGTDSGVGRWLSAAVRRVPGLADLARQADRTRAMRTIACLIQTGMPTTDALRRGATVLLRASDRARAEVAVELGPTDDAAATPWRAMGFGAAVAARASAALRRAPSDAAETLQRLADESGSRLLRAIDRRLALLRPSAVFLVAITVALQLNSTFQVIFAAQESTKPW